MNAKNERNRINQFRLLKNGVTRKFPDISTCLSSLCGIQSQILSASYLSIFNRVDNIKYENISEALIYDRSIIRVWAYRSTLHLINSCEWDLMVSAISEDRSWFKDKINKANCEEEYSKITQNILKFVSEQDVFSRSDLMTCFESSDKYDFYISSWGGMLIDLSQRGLICHAPIGQKINFAFRNNWLYDIKSENIDIANANITLLRHFIDSYGPVEIEDFAFWRGIKKSDSADYFKSISNELHKIDFNNKYYFINKKDEYLYYNFDYPQDSIILLYRFDPILLAYKDKSNIVDFENYKRIWQVAGHVEGVILKSGFIIGRWNYKKSKLNIKFQYDFFYKISDLIIEQVINKSVDITEFIGGKDIKYQINRR